ncbi:coatomer epsilon subunit-domain-containing protein [Cladochytrium replicatum]|nr:coatomer epsilon subunit-domain-containing protein [Cladochytrium replicatum]
MSNGFDELLHVRNLFYIGAYQQVINECTVIRSSDPRILLEQQTLLYRSQIALGRYSTVQNEIDPQSAPVELKAVRVAGQLYEELQRSGKPDEDVIDELRTLVSGASGSSLLGSVAAVAFLAGGYWEDALKAVAGHSKSIDCVALMIQAYLMLDSQDLALKELEGLKSWADDATLAQLAEAWTHLYLGGEGRIQDAFYVFEELASSKTTTAKLLTAQAVCRMQLGRFADAERLLQDALSKSNSDPDTLANLIVCGYATGKAADAISQYLILLTDVAPSHPLVVEKANKESLFDRAAAKYAF